MHTQSLSFTLKIARTKQDVAAACRVRAESYGHHVPALYSMLMEPDLLDASPDTAIFLCVDKQSGAAIGTARLQTNAGGTLLIEYSTAPPEYMKEDTRAEVTRLSVLAGADPLVRISLVKASWMYCISSQIRWTLIGSRSAALTRQYRSLGFQEAFGDGRTVQLRHAGRLEHTILAFNVTTAERTWIERKHALYDFMVGTFHPDINLFSTQPALPARTPLRAVVLPESIAALTHAMRPGKAAGVLGLAHRDEVDAS